MACVSIVSYSVLINGNPSFCFKPKRGFDKQILFLNISILCVKEFNALLNKVENAKKIIGVRIAKGAPIVNYLVFAYDSLLFCQANRNEWLQIQNILGIYEHAFGQVLNQQNTSIFSDTNTSSSVKNQLLNIVGVSECSSHEKYLSLPSFMGKSKYSNFEALGKKCESRLIIGRTCIYHRLERKLS